MKINIDSKELKKLTELVDNANYKIVGEENAINTPAICIKASLDSVIMVALNREMYIEVPMNATVLEEGYVVVDPSVLKRMIKLLSEGAVEISSDEINKKVILKSGEDPIEINNLDLVKFKKLPEFNNKKKLCSVIADTLSNSIKAVSSAIPTKAPQAALNSCCLEFDIGNISFIGFDGYKLIKYDLEIEELEEALDFREKILIPSEAAIAIAKSLQKGKSLVDLYFCDNNGKRYVVIEKDKIVIATRLRDYNYPDYQKLLRSDYEFTFVIDKSKLKETIASITGIGSAKEALPVLFLFEGNKVSLRFVTQDSTISKTLDIESSNGELKRFRMLAKSLKDTFPYFKDKIRVKYFDGGLLIITPESSSEYIFVTRTLE